MRTRLIAAPLVAFAVFALGLSASGCNKKVEECNKLIQVMNAEGAKLSPKGYEELSRWKMLDPTGAYAGRAYVWSHPAFANRCVYARNDKELVCVSLAK